MKQFGVWIGKDQPDISAIKAVYPDFFIIDGSECPLNKTGNAIFDSDAIRIWYMATQWIEEDAMYLDCNDMNPFGEKLFTGLGFTWPAYWNASGRPDINFIYRPCGTQSHFIKLLNYFLEKMHSKIDPEFNAERHIGWAQSYLAQSLLHEVSLLSSGYFSHKNRGRE
jgi:hypothetical protein